MKNQSIGRNRIGQIEGDDEYRQNVLGELPGETEWLKTKEKQ